MSPYPLYIDSSIDMYVKWHDNVNPAVEQGVDPALAFSNYTKDCVYQELYNVTYEDYMVSVIDQLI